MCLGSLILYFFAWCTVRRKCALAAGPDFPSYGASEAVRGCARHGWALLVSVSASGPQELGVSHGLQHLHLNLQQPECLHLIFTH